MICEFIVSPRLLAEDSPATTSDSEAPAMTSEPMMPADKPEWVATIDSLEGSVHRLSVSTELLESPEACRAQLDETLLAATRRYIVKNLIEDQAAELLPALTIAWVREHWLVPDREWEAVLTRPSGTYYQLWVELEIFPEDRELIKKWYKELETRRRSLLCLILCLCVGGTAGVANLGLRVLGSGQTMIDRPSII